MSIFLSASDPPQLMAPGLYAGLKSRRGYPSPLPARLKDDYYVNAGSIDGLSASLIRRLNLSQVFIRLTSVGSICFQWYYLTKNGQIRQFSEEPIIASPDNDDIVTISDIEVPQVLLADKSIALIFFRILNHKVGDQNLEHSQLINWCFYSTQNWDDFPSQPALRLLSRSFGDALQLIKQHLGHQLWLTKLERMFPDLGFLPMPRLHIYESDKGAYERCIEHVKAFNLKHSDLTESTHIYFNPFNLGGGGNMCIALNHMQMDSSQQDDFVMMDSDTLVPFKTLYSSALISVAAKSSKGPSEVYSPIIAYRKHPTRVLEAGAIFGRGSWNLAENLPVQPCILPIYEGADLSDKKDLGLMYNEMKSDYPPFIYGLYHLSVNDKIESLLPAPFFLRGDDIEYGLYLHMQGVSVNVTADLIVFQDPKHSLWHELLAILHATVILLAYTEKSDYHRLSRHLSIFFGERMADHASIHDLHGISVYHEVIKRLLSLITLSDDKLLDEFYDPIYYSKMRTINSRFTELNYRMAKSIASHMNQNQYQEIPFLYFPRQASDVILPRTIVLMNHITETASVHHPHDISLSTLNRACIDYQQDLSRLLGSLDRLNECCIRLVDRKSILNYISKFPIDSNKNSLEMQS